MFQNNAINRRIVLNSRPVGAPKLDNFRLVELDVPEIGPGQILLRTRYLSLDPYMRGRMSEATSYTASTKIGEVMPGGTISAIQASNNQDFAIGDLVLCYSGWQDYSISDGTNITKLEKDLVKPSMALGVLGMPGFTAYMGLLDIGQPQAGETLVVAAASGAVGSIVGQIAKIKGCRVVGIAGGPEKCKFVVEKLGFDLCIDHHQVDFAQQLASACQSGIDIYFESVGGKVFDAVLPLLNTHARIPVCGLISSYNDKKLAKGTDRLNVLTRTILTKRLKMQGFIIFEDYGDRFNEFYHQMKSWIKQDNIQFLEDIQFRLENAPVAFIGMLEGKNFGKLIMEISQ